MYCKWRFLRLNMHKWENLKGKLGRKSASYKIALSFCPRGRAPLTHITFSRACLFLLIAICYINHVPGIFSCHCDSKFNLRSQASSCEIIANYCNGCV